MTLTSKEIKEILAILEDSGWDEATVTVGEVTLTMSKNGIALPVAAAPGGGAAVPAVATAPAPAAVVPAQPAASPAAAALPQPVAAAGHVIASPSVGVFWRAPQPGAPPFVEVGDAVEAGRQLGIVEVMKLMTPVYADVDGTVAAFHTGNGDKVEHGTPLVTIAES